MRAYDLYVKLYNGRLPTEFDPKYLELLRMSKYRILPAPDIKPSKCANCGASKVDGRPYIDFGLQVDWYGVVFLCGLCLLDIAEKAGLFEPHLAHIENLKKQIAINDTLTKQGIKVEEKVTHIFEEVKNYFDNLHSSGNVDTPSVPVDVVVESENSDGEAIIETSGQSTEAHKRPIKSATGSGSKNIPSLAELLNAKD